MFVYQHGPNDGDGSYNDAYVSKVMEMIAAIQADSNAPLDDIRVVAPVFDLAKQVDGYKDRNIVFFPGDNTNISDEDVVINNVVYLAVDDVSKLDEENLINESNGKNPAIIVLRKGNGVGYAIVIDGNTMYIESNPGRTSNIKSLSLIGRFFMARDFVRLYSNASKLKNFDAGGDAYFQRSKRTVAKRGFFC